MISFGVYTKSNVIKNEILSSLESLNDKSVIYSPEFFDDLESALDFLTYTQVNSRLFVLEYALSSSKEIKSLVNRIYNDPWLHGTTVVLIAESISHEEAQEFLQEGVIDLIAVQEIPYKFQTIVKLSTTNTAIFESQQFSKEIITHKKGKILLRNNLSLVPKVTAKLMGYCYTVGFRDMEHFSKISLSLHEMLTNAIEHGNCGIGFSRKTEILHSNKGMAEVIAELNKNPNISKKRVKIEFDLNSEKAVFIITDQGNGFKLTDLPLPASKENIFSIHGRGIMMTKTFVDSLEFNEKGNQVKIVIYNYKLSKTRENSLSKFVKEGPMQLKSGDVLIEDGSESHYFYYIIEGKLGVFIKDKQVDILTPEDIFVGEMAFLNRNKRTATVIALSDAKVIPISRRGFIDMIKSYPYSGVVLARLLSKRLIRRNRVFI